MKTRLNRWLGHLARCFPALVLTLSLLLAALPQPHNLSAATVAHHFSGITFLPDKTAALSLDGSVANMFNLTGTISNQFRQMFDLYPVEASSNLLDWTRLTLLLRANNNTDLLLFQDTRPAGLNRCFYRTFTNHLLTAFPRPTGPFAVGTVDRVMIDPAWTNPYPYWPATNAFMVTFWYWRPVSQKQAVRWERVANFDSVKDPRYARFLFMTT